MNLETTQKVHEKSSKETATPNMIRTFCLLFVFALGLSLRLWRLGDLPAGFFCDEAALGYNAWSLLKFGIDENGARWPLFVWSFGGFKNPVYIYSSFVPIAVFGLDEFSTRFAAAIYGSATVLVVYLLLNRVVSRSSALCGAILLAILPWHLHFSRIAFELITLPFFLSLGLWLTFRAFDKKLSFIPGALSLAICFYCYAVAKLFVPILLIGALALFWSPIRERWRSILWGLGAFLVATIPVVLFDVLNRERAFAYSANTSAFKGISSLTDGLHILLRNYQEFFSYRFLFENGDGVLRHSVPGHGELLLVFGPLLLLGLLRVLILRRPRETLLLWGLLCYPLAPSLMNEIPSASRGIPGALFFTLFAAVGVEALQATIGYAIRRVRLPTLSASIFASLLVASGAGIEFYEYWKDYVQRYPVLSARSLYGFQFGYRDAVRALEAHREEGLPLLMTATEVNQPYIFALFYRQVPPHEYLKNANPGYLIISPEEFNRYDTNGDMYFVLRPGELELFRFVDEQEPIMAPDGEPEFVLAKVRGLKSYITSWLVLGLFDNADERGMLREQLDPTRISRSDVTEGGRTHPWRKLDNKFLTTDLNDYFGLHDKDSNGNPEHVCAYLLTGLHVTADSIGVRLELTNVSDPGVVWVNGNAVGAFARSEMPSYLPFTLQAGSNQLLLKTCEVVGDWKLRVRLIDDNNEWPANVTVVSTWNEIEQKRSGSRIEDYAADLDVHEGFSEIVRYAHEKSDYESYRGRENSWWVYGNQGENEVSWRTGPVRADQPVLLAFTASMGEEPGTGELFVNGKFIVEFDVDDDFTARRWDGDGARLTYLKKTQIAGSSGVFLLQLSKELVGQSGPLELSVRVQSGAKPAWFMIKDRKDTVSYEQITATTLRAIEPLLFNGGKGSKGIR